jgi:hypothetical protein
VFAPHAKLRGKVGDRAGQAVLRWDEPARSAPLAQRVRQALGFSVAMQLPQPESAAPASPGASQWVRLSPPHLRGRPAAAPALRLVAFIIEHSVIVRNLGHLGESSDMPRAAPIRDPPDVGAWRQTLLAEIDVLALDPIPQLMPHYEEQRQDLG